MKNLKTLALILTMLVVLSLALVSCGEKDEHVHVFSDATCTAPKTCECGATEGEALGHTVVTDAAVAPTCTEPGLTEGSHCSVCDEVLVAQTEVAATGHDYKAEVTEPTCTADGFTTYTCACGDVDVVTDKPATGHDHKLTENTATCTAAGTATYTCACGDTYTEASDIADHVDTNLDITCDFDGCTHRILPKGDTKISLFTANSMIIVSLNNNYYVEGVITEITDAKNGVFIIEDEAGDTILVRLPKDADGNLYATFSYKVVVGDTVQLYGKPVKNINTPATQKAKIEGALLTVLKHEHEFSEVTCSESSVCACLTVNAEALGHIDGDSNGLCDRCEWNMRLQTTNIAVMTDPSANGVLDDAKTKWVWSDGTFDVEIAKGGSTFTLYTSSKTYMQLKKQNTFTVSNTTGAKMKSITIFTTNATQLTNLEKAMAGLTFTKDEAALSITVELNSTENFTFTNVGANTAYISGVEIVYEPATAE